VAPSLIPIKAGDRVKTDRRDALMLAKLHRASAFFSHSYALLPIGYPMGRFGPVRCIPLADGATLTTLYLQFVAGDGNLVRLAGSSNIHTPLRGSGLNPSRSARP
jgi:hypothetical protein